MSAVALVVLSGYPGWVRTAAAFWLVGAIVLGAVDGLVHRLPLRIVGALSLGTTALLSAAAYTAGDWADLRRALLAGGVLAVVFFLLCLPRGGLGLGDAALAFPIGLVLGWFGWPTVAAWVLLTSLLSALTGIALIATGRASRKSRLPLGPFMLVAAVLAAAIS